MQLRSLMKDHPVLYEILRKITLKQCAEVAVKEGAQDEISILAKNFLDDIKPHTKVETYKVILALELILASAIHDMVEDYDETITLSDPAGIGEAAQATKKLVEALEAMPKA